MDLPSTSSQGGANAVVRSNTVLMKTKLVRGIKSLLYSLGYDRKGKSLEKGPEIELHKERVDFFIEQIIDGKCDECLRTLLDIGKHVNEKSLLILEHTFYEKVKEACTALGHEIAPFGNSDEIVHKLSILTVSPPQNFCSQQSIFGPRRKVLEKMRDLLIEVCRMYMARDITLVTNHQRGGEEAPYRIIQKLRGDMGEVWFLKFSHNGKYLAASTSNRAVYVWEVLESGGFSVPSKLEGHLEPVSYLTWRANDLELLTCGVEETVKRWNIPPTGDFSCVRTYGKVNLGTVSCAWAPDGVSIFTGLNDGSISMWNLQGEEVRFWEDSKTTRIADLAVTREGTELISISEYDTILLFDWETGNESFIHEDENIVSFSRSEDGDFLLVSMSNRELHVWDIGLDGPVMLLTYDGITRQRFVVRSCFCGIDQTLIASGSEDSKVYIWNRESGVLMCTLEGHSDVVNCVAFNPVRTNMLASGSDDCTIAIWG